MHYLLPSFQKKCSIHVFCLIISRPPLFLTIVNLFPTHQIISSLLLCGSTHRNSLRNLSIFFWVQTDTLHTNDWYDGIADNTELISIILPPKDKNRLCYPSSRFCIFSIISIQSLFRSFLSLSGIPKYLIIQFSDNRIFFQLSHYQYLFLL